MSGSKELLTTTEFDKKTGVSASTVSKWIRTEKIKGEKKGGKWYIADAEISKISSASPRKVAEFLNGKRFGPCLGRYGLGCRRFLFLRRGCGFFRSGFSG